LDYLVISRQDSFDCEKYEGYRKETREGLREAWQIPYRRGGGRDSVQTGDNTSNCKKLLSIELKWFPRTTLSEWPAEFLLAEI
jgi:hypothetical protein